MRKVIEIILWILLVSGLLYAIFFTYVRVFEKGDYVVTYTIPCDPLITECFSEEICDELSDECEISYYSSIKRIESNLERICGFDILNCPLAETCAYDEIGCSVTFCNPQIDNCTSFKIEGE